MEKLVDIERLSELLSVKVSTIYGWVHEDYIPYYKINRLVRFDPTEIREWLRKKNSRKHRVPIERHNA